MHPNFKTSLLILAHNEEDGISPALEAAIDAKYQKKEIKTIGVDYKVLENYYICNDCDDKFAEPSQEYLCLRCNNRFKLDQAKWITSEGFRGINL